MTVYEADWVCPASGPPLRHGALAVDKGVIHQVGPAAALHGSRVRFPGCAIIPGFVNAHAHLELTILRGFLENLSFLDWIQNLVRAKYQGLTRDALKISAQLGAIEMLRAGVTTVGEVMDVGTGLEAMVEFGLQGVAYQEVFGPSDSVAAESLRGLQLKIEEYRSHQTERLRIGVSPHAPYTVSKSLYRATRDFARQNALPMTAHIAESTVETEFVRDGAGPFANAFASRAIEVTPRGCLPVAYLDEMELLGPDMLLIHAIEIDDRDLVRIAESGTVVVHCPKSNAKLGHDIARVRDMRALGVAVALGTDSVASNNVVDMFEEMRTAIFHQRVLTGRVEALTATDAFRMATIEGARCLTLDDQLGSLDFGKRADFVVVDLRGAATQPVYDPIETIVFSASRADVRATYVGGREISVDDTEILKETALIAQRLTSAFPPP